MPVEISNKPSGAAVAELLAVVTAGSSVGVTCACPCPCPSWASGVDDRDVATGSGSMPAACSTYVCATIVVGPRLLGLCCRSLGGVQFYPISRYPPFSFVVARYNTRNASCICVMSVGDSLRHPICFSLNIQKFDLATSIQTCICI
jgi:hypothetical protein